MADKNEPYRFPDGREDWRVATARHLAGLKLRRKPYQRYSESWDHDHCVACSAKFAEFDGPDVQHVGPTTGDDYKFGADYEWVCPRCFSELQPVLGWTEADDGSDAA